ncbi:hypothetical protein EWM64_g2086 [Hericium alpestre]|uniref:Uncharacterized protein n=1 Tax=Hericium alpestre TaxID=135208 RepID=A0A4Z0A6F2_9AGAM|nr:hypothetical protein EWM64_g2086 [Hericium alpestre]
MPLPPKAPSSQAASSAAPGKDIASDMKSSATLISKGKKRKREAKTEDDKEDFKDEEPKAKKRRAAPKTKKTKEVSDPSTWPPSTLSQDTTISKMYAKDWYKLSDKDLAPLKFESTRNDKGYNMYLYKAAQVERTAWEKYGGPEGFEQTLKEKEEKWKAKHPGKCFPRPDWVKVKKCRTCGMRIREDFTYEFNKGLCNECAADVRRSEHFYDQFDPEMENSGI